MEYYERKAQGFSQIMVKRLKENEDKGGWDDCDVSWLLVRLRDEARELHDAYLKSGDEKIIEEAADVANFCMMIADVCGGLE